MSDKGVFGARLDSLSACGANVCVFQTHLQASYDSPTEHSEVRANQLDQLYRFVHASLARTTPGSTAALLVGDFNVVGDGDEYRDMLGRLPGARDLYREGHPGDAGYTFDGELNHNMIGADERTVRQRLDYVLGFDAIPASGGLPPVPLRPVRVVSRRIVAFGAVDSRLSDHFGVEAVVEV
jgi:endonuclease/exonuclease/phosphatase family metal-dependent hydrolase